MAFQGKLVIDADTHVYEPADRLPEYMEKPFKDMMKDPAVQTKLNPQSAFEGNAKTFMPGQRAWKRPLGVDATQAAPKTQGAAGDTLISEASWGRIPAADCNVNPASRVRDMDEEGVDVGIIFPTAITGAAALEINLEQALYRSYNRWVADFCGQVPTRLKGIMVSSFRDVEGTAAEIKRVAKENWCVGLLLTAPPEGSLLDDTSLHPVWAAVQEADFALMQHCFTPRAPHFPGFNDMGDNSFVAGTCSMPFAAMRNTAALIGGGVFEKFRQLRYGIVEAGTGWFPYFLGRIDRSAAARQTSVPQLHSRPSDFLKSGRFFIGFGFDEDAATLNYVSNAIGDGHLVYGSDYCHVECHFPNSLKNFTSQRGIAERRMKEVLGETAKRLYARI
jgi:predicted TIM-barrel fold metal-dependent hydrolase